MQGIVRAQTTVLQQSEVILHLAAGTWKTTMSYLPASLGYVVFIMEHVPTSLFLSVVCMTPRVDCTKQPVHNVRQHLPPQLLQTVGYIYIYTSIYLYTYNICLSIYIYVYTIAAHITRLPWLVRVFPGIIDLKSEGSSPQAQARGPGQAALGLSRVTGFREAWPGS